MKFARLGTKTKMHPAMIPGSVSGNVTRRKLATGPAPRSAAACAEPGPSRSIEA